LGLCLEYKATEAGQSSCSARFNGPFHSEPANQNASVAQLLQLLEESRAEKTGGTIASRDTAQGPATGLGQAESTEPSAPSERLQQEREAEEEAGLGEAEETEGGTEPLLDYLLGQGE